MKPTASDVEAIEQAIDRRVHTRTAKKLSRQVIRAQEALRKQVSKRAWATYLRVEDAVNERDFALVDAVIRLTFRIAWQRFTDSELRRIGRAFVEVRHKTKS